MASYNNYYHDYPYTGTVRDRYPSNVSSSGHGTAVPPTAGPSPPPRAPPAARPHTTQPQPGYGYGPPPLPQGYPAPPRGGGVYGAHYAGYPQFGGYGAPPMSYADSLPVQPSMLGAGGGNAGNPKSPRIEEKDGRDPSKPDPDTLNSKSPVSSSPPLSNAAALAQAEAAVPGISERLPDFKDWPAEDRDRAIRELVERLAPQKYPPAGYGHPPPPQHYPGHPYYGFYPPPMPHAGYNPHMPPPHHEGYGYPPPPLLPLQPPQLPQQQNAERDDYSGEEAEERERIDRERERERAGAGAGNGGAQIMPGGYASSPSRETPSSPPPPQPQSNIHSRPATPQNTPPNPKSPPPVQPQNNNKIVDLQDAHNRDRPGSMPPPKTRPVKTPAPEDMGKNMSNSLHMLGRMGSRREQHGKVGAGAADSTLVEQLGPGGQGDMTTIGAMWGVYLLEHKGQKKGSLPELRPKLRGLLGGIAAWINQRIRWLFRRIS
ncbi:hypothetical protein L211DRAFT_465057 [Terfezia boudieri ATCC MYA-4762]|uniref:Uncharacterized protein n=1 Tax=Terfezia boudieri ATCC MYA-4762 TaxID=1051890 RepID=A0A3N4M1R7_9PEZI|nr:hypothetical protein L211DRAFT_465057 [Terfezia boudieri ATCC MYA-4762]